MVYALMYSQLDILDFLNKAEGFTIIDARSEKEYLQGHIPGAINIPILNNDERVAIGTCYKKKGKQEAVLLGFDLVGKRFGDIARKANAEISNKNIFVYCWRGGMRSNILSWVLSVVGFKVSLLKGGYKKYRNNVLQNLASPPPFLVLGGATGSGKTHLLKELENLGQQVLDLEGLSNHRGSAYGALGMQKQPSNEQFENYIAEKLRRTKTTEFVWIENESRLIGANMVPESIYLSLRESPLVEIVLNINERIKIILKDYAVFPKEDLIKSTEKIQKRLGGLRTKEAIQAILEDRYEDWLKIVLEYYDKTYSYGLSERKGSTIAKVEVEYFELNRICEKLIAIENNTVKMLLETKNNNAH